MPAMQEQLLVRQDADMPVKSLVYWAFFKQVFDFSSIRTKSPYTDVCGHLPPLCSQTYPQLMCIKF
jgi:hypothetical protein